MHKLARILIITGLILPLVLTPRSAQACTCDMAVVVMMWPPPAESLAESAAVFEGTVVGSDVPSLREQELYRKWSYQTHNYPYIRSLTQPLVRLVAKPYTAVTFEVTRSWKGVTYEQVEITTRSCAMNLFVGGTYLVYGSLGDGRLVSDGCFQSKLIDMAEPDLNYLASQPTLPLAPAPFQSGRLFCCTIPILLIGAFFTWRRYR